MDKPAPKIVALGGGHGLAASLSALRHLTRELTGIVTVADNGGSSGRLREELGVLPPGDLRMALAALCGSNPIPASSGKTHRHRLNRGGDRAANNALYTVALQPAALRSPHPPIR